MRKLSLMLLAAGLGLAHGQTLVWSKVLGDEGLQTLKAIRTDAEGNILLFGLFNRYPMDSGPARPSFGGVDVFLHKLNPSGRTVWFRNMGSGYNSDRALDMDADSVGNIYVLADMSSFLGGLGRFLTGDSDTLKADPAGKSGFTFGKYSPDGKVLWIRQFQDPDEAQLRQIRVCNGKVVLTGDFSEKVKFLGTPDSLVSDSQGYHGFLAEMDGEGRILSMAAVDSVESVLMARSDGSGGLLLGLSKSPRSGETFLERRRSNGEIAWRRPMRVETGEMGFQDLAADGEGSFYVGGRIQSGTRVNLGGGRDTVVNVSNPPGFYVMKLDTAGNPAWYKFGLPGYSPFSNFTLAPDRTLTLMSFSNGQTWRFDAAGRVVWNFKATSGGIHTEHPPGTALDPTGAIVFGVTLFNRATFLGHSFVSSGIENTVLFKVTGEPTVTRKNPHPRNPAPSEARPWWIRFFPNGRARPSPK